MSSVVQGAARSVGFVSFSLRSFSRKGAARSAGYHLAITCVFAVLVPNGGRMFFGRSRSQDVSSQDSFSTLFSRIGGRFGSTYWFRYSGLARAVIHMLARVCGTLAIVREFFDAASRT